LAAVLLSVVSAQSRADDATTLTKIATVTQGVGDISHALNIKKVVGAYHLSAPVAEVRLKFLFYHNGDLDNSRTISHGLRAGATDSGKFALQIVDLDYLPLRDAEPGHHRLHYQIANANGSAASNVDIPKSTFDVTSTFGMFRFAPKAGKPNEAPLFAIVGGDTKSFAGADTPQAVVEANPEADILIAVLEFKR